MVTCSMLCQIRECSPQRNSGNLERCEAKKAPIHANSWHLSSDQRLEAFAHQSSDEITIRYM